LLKSFWQHNGFDSAPRLRNKYKMWPTHNKFRKETERQFHNQRYGAGHDIREPLSKWYAAVAASARTQNEMVRRYGKGGKVLEYGCADGRISLGDHLADDAASFHGIDISDQAIDIARKSAASQELTNYEFTVMDAENMSFSDNEFDVVFGRGILHHLDLSRCFPEIARVLRPGGKAIFNEPLGHNPALNLFRKMTPHLRTPDEHPLLMSDLRFAQTRFRSVDYEFFGLTTLLAVPLQKTSLGPGFMRFCEQTDSLLLRLPLIQR
jgi:2-polyprenyl-3-methyl-5-hydroxy-6-metoxy-1,4-benzoquinol methylase